MNSEPIAGIASMMCGMCHWEVVYLIPEESELILEKLRHHAWTAHGRKHTEVAAVVENY